MERQIGEAAGKVWQALNKGPMRIAQISAATGLSAILTQQAVGWLAREGKIASEVGAKGMVLKLKG